MSKKYNYPEDYLQQLAKYLIVALTELDQQTKNLSLSGPKPTTVTVIVFLSLLQGCGMACHNCC
jgi:cell division protein ZapA (FtsZ GTPase activity inhibitor)